uniref:Thioredoxin domain-containing protein 17 n=1 Tax=Brugia malayi TaxID=6279 RepID=A0A1I9G104_BRUMA|nr:Bm9224 [Brugia malayi]
MTFNRKKVEGLNELNTLLKDLKCRTVILFSGSKDGGKSWCPDCVQAEPVIEKVIEQIVSSNDTDIDLTFIECAVGPRTWQAKRLSGEQCANELLVKELFLED